VNPPFIKKCALTGANSKFCYATAFHVRNKSLMSVRFVFYALNIPHCGKIRNFFDTILSVYLLTAPKDGAVSKFPAEKFFR